MNRLRACGCILVMGTVFTTGCERTARQAARLIPAQLVAYGYPGDPGVFKEKVTRESSADLEVKDADTLDVQVEYGRIKVVSSDGAARVEATFSVQARDQQEGQKALDRFKLEVQRIDRTVSVRVKGEPLEIQHGNQTIKLGPAVDITATVPEAFKVKLHPTAGDVTVKGPIAACAASTGFGQIDLTDVHGDVAAESTSGSVSLSRCEGRDVKLSSRFGAITMDHVTSKKVSAETASGHVTLGHVKADALDAGSSFGNVTMTDVAGRLTAHSSSGEISVERAEKGELDLTTNYGAVRVAHAGGSVRAVSKSGNVTVDEFEGVLTAETSFGSIRATGTFTAVHAESKSGTVEVTARRGSEAASGWAMNSGFGDLLLTLPEGFGCEVEATTKFGSIRANGFNAPKPAQQGSGERLIATLGKGGSPVALQTKSGNIILKEGAGPRS